MISILGIVCFFLCDIIGLLERGEKCVRKTNEIRKN